MADYITPAAFGEAELIEKRSRFISRVWPLGSEKEALERIAEIRSRHRDASHNVYAYILREGAIMRYSDDGEPGGTSGMPTLNVFRSEGITDFCCIVTRYFGGTLLGAGGLSRAYSAAAKLALDAAGRVTMSLWSVFSLSCAYGQYEQVKRLLDLSGAIIQDTDFGADVRIEAIIKEEAVEDCRAALLSLTAGKSELRVTGGVYHR